MRANRRFLSVTYGLLGAARLAVLPVAALAAGGRAAAAQAAVSEPDLRIGTSEDDPRDQFARLGDAVALPDGRIAVLDLGQRQVRLYGRDGRWLRDLGRRGDGPGEYREPIALSHAANTVVVLDATGRLLLHPGNGGDASTRAVRLPSLDGGIFRLTVDLPLSDALVLLRANERTFGRVRGDYRATTGVLLWRESGAIDTLAWLPSDSLRADAGGVPVPRPFVPALGLLTAASGTRVAVLQPETGQVHVYATDGRAIGSWASGLRPQQLRPADLQRLRADRLRGLGGNDARVVGEWFDGQPGPPRPVVATRIFLADDALWLERPVREDGRAEWIAFSLAGVRRFALTLPSGFELLDVQGDQLLGIRRDEFDVDILERRRFRAPRGGGQSATPFAPHLTTVNGLAFEPDGSALYLSRRVPALDDRGRQRTQLFRHTRSDTAWSTAEPLWHRARHTDYQPVLSPDAQRLYFTSTRPQPGTATELRQNIWHAERGADGWGEPQMVAELASPSWDGYAVPTSSGRLYFVSDRAGGRGAADIWVAAPSAGGGYGAPVNVSALNSEHTDSDLWVDPDERFAIFHRWVDAESTADFWLALGKDGEWRAPRPLKAVNGPGVELSPTVAENGAAFFFQRDGVIYRAPLCALFSAEERRTLDLTCVDPGTAAALDSANARFSAAYLRGDVDALVAAYTPDAILHPPAGGVRLGLDAARGIWRGSAEGRLGHRIEALLRRPLADGTVLEMGRWHSRRATSTDPDPDWLWGCYTVIWRKDEGAGWRMFYDYWSAPHTEDWACRPRP